MPSWAQGAFVGTGCPALPDGPRSDAAPCQRLAVDGRLARLAVRLGFPEGHALSLAGAAVGQGGTSWKPAWPGGVAATSRMICPVSSILSGWDRMVTARAYPVSPRSIADFVSVAADRRTVHKAIVLIGLHRQGSLESVALHGASAGQRAR